MAAAENPISSNGNIISFPTALGKATAVLIHGNLKTRFGRRCALDADTTPVPVFTTLDDAVAAYPDNFTIKVAATRFFKSTNTGVYHWCDDERFILVNEKKIKEIVAEYEEKGLLNNPDRFCEVLREKSIQHERAHSCDPLLHDEHARVYGSFFSLNGLNRSERLADIYGIIKTIQTQTMTWEETLQLFKLMFTATQITGYPYIWGKSAEIFARELRTIHGTIGSLPPEEQDEYIRTTTCRIAERGHINRVALTWERFRARPKKIPGVKYG